MRNRKTLFSSLFIALFLCTIPQIFAADLYVSNASGNDANDGSSWGLAKKTIMAAITASSSGDNIKIEGGTYQEQVVIGAKSLTISGSLGSLGRTTITAPATGTMTTYTMTTDLTWTGAGKLSSNVIKPIVFVNAPDASYTVNIKGIDIDGITATMDQSETSVFVGLAHRYALGTIGGSAADYIEVKNIKHTTGSANALNNTAGILFLQRSKPTLQNTRVQGYRNIGIGIIGYSTSTSSSIVIDQPYPTIQDCIVSGETAVSASSSEDYVQTGIMIANGANALIRRNHIHGNRSGNNSDTRFAYGIYTNDARTIMVGDNSVKSNGNIISDNEIALYVRVPTSSISTNGYTIRNNNIVYNGGQLSGLASPSGKIASYGNAVAVNTSYGIARFSHADNRTQTLTLNNNAFGNSEAHLFFNYSGNPYTPASYSSAPAAFWRETGGDVITYLNPLSAPIATNLTVNSSFAPSNTSGTPIIDVEYGYTKFEQLNKAVYAAQLLSVGIVPPRIDVQSNLTENETIVITKPVKIIGYGSSCSAYPSITLRNGINEPVIWFYGMLTGAGNMDAANRFPRRDTLMYLRILANDLQTSSADVNGAPAVLFTGSTFGTNSPLTPVLSFMSISNQFDGIGQPRTYSASQAGNVFPIPTNMRFAGFTSGPYNVKYTRRPENCSTLVNDDNVIDWTDDNSLARFRFDNNVYVADCAELNAAVAGAEGPDPTSVIVTAIIPGVCEVIVNNTETIIMDAQTGGSATVHYLLNPGTGPGYGGGSRQICSFTQNVTSGGTITAPRVTVYPPACLQTAVDLVTPGATNLLVASDGSVGSPLPFTVGTLSNASPVTIAKQFDFQGATSGTAHLSSPTAGNATYTGKFELNVGADIHNTAGTLTSTRGSVFGETNNQVDLTFSSNSLTNFPGGDAIEMALQLISTTGSRRLNLTTASHSTENPIINKRVHIEGLSTPARGTTVGTITLNGSGNCTDPSVLRRLNLANAIVNSDADCIQTALGIANCTTYTQDIEGVGTSSTDGSGGTVNLNSVAYTQNIDIAKSVTFTNKNTTTGTVTLRKGAAVTGLDNFTNTVNLEQCASFTGATNPSPTDGIAIANSGTGVINIAGYGAANPSTGNGVWSFSNINVNKDVEIRGNYHSTAASDLTCSLLETDNLPLISSSRVAGSETVIGTHDDNTLSIADPVFIVSASGASIKGFSVRNVIANPSVPFVRIDGVSSDIEVHNNIVANSALSSVSSPNEIIGLVQTNNTSTISNIDISGNNYTTTGISTTAITLSDIGNTTGSSIISNNVISGSFAGVNALELSDISNTIATGVSLSNNWIKSAGGTGLKLTSVGLETLNGITVERNNFNTSANGIEVSTSHPVGSNGVTIRENYINGNNDGVEISGNLSLMTTNQIFVNNNNLALNTNGIHITATTDKTVATTNMLDLRFNWWGSALGPVRGTNEATHPSLAGSDNLTVIGHVPFTHLIGSKIEDVNDSTHGRWMVYPVATTASDGNVACGWQFNPDDMMKAVLRVNSGTTLLLGHFNTITEARDFVGNTSDQIFILGPSLYNSTSYGYPSGSSPEPAYPVVFSAAGHPATIKGLTYPTINAGNINGSIKVASTFPQGFTISNYIKHISDAGNHTVLDFQNPYGNTVRNNYMTSNKVAPASYTAISISGGATSETHSIQHNIINLTDGGNGEAWPGSATVTTNASVPVIFTGVSFTGTSALSAIKVSCNEIIGQTTTGSTSTGIVYNSTIATPSIVNIDSNDIHTMAVGVAYTLNSPYGFTSNINTKANSIINGLKGVQINGSLVPMVTNKLFVNNNDLSGNTTAGIDLQATTSHTVATTNLLDLRFNWWGSNLGPVIGSTVASTPSLIGSDSLMVIGHVPFTHTSGTTIEDINGALHGRWMIYPSATVATNASTSSCGWQYTHMMPAVIRVNAARNLLLGAYTTIAEGRDGTTSAFGITEGGRTTTDELFVLGPSSYGVATFGYPTTTGHESYPIGFSSSPQPSTIKGLTYPTINAGTSSGTISVGGAFPAGFSVLDYIKHISAATNHTVLTFANAFGNTVKNNYMASNSATPTSYTGISMTAGSGTHTVQDNKINMTDGGTGNAWPGSASITTTASTPTTFVGISFTGTSTAANLNVVCNDIIANSTTGSTGVQYTSALASSGTVNIESNNIRSMGSGIHYTFSAGYGFTNNVTAKENFIISCARAIRFDGTFASMITNKIFVNNNNLANAVNAGVDLQATTANNVATTNMLDLRFNWWGSNLGPSAGGGVATAPDFAGSDSLTVKGHIPFTHTNGSYFVDVNGTTHGRWMVYPAAITSTDATPIGCGWQYNDMMPAVLRVNATADVLLGGYAKIDEGRTSSNNVSGISAGLRNTTDQLYILGPSTYGPATFGYPASSGHETYPIVFNAANEPSTIKGLTYPVINTSNTLGAIRVGSSFPAGFSVLDYIKHYSDANTHTVLAFQNPFGNTIKNQYMTSNNLGTASSANGDTYIGIDISAGATGQVHTIQHNRINLTDNTSLNGQAWPGSSDASTSLPWTSYISQPETFTAISLTGTAGESIINVTCNNFVAQRTSGSTGILYTSNAANNGAVNIVANTISRMGAGIHYTFNSGFGFADNIIAKENYITNGYDGVVFSGFLEDNNPNTLFVNNNNLSGNVGSTGIYVKASMDDNAPSTNFLDLRFNWWGSDLGPIRSTTGIGSIPSLATDDSIYVRGYVPFNHVYDGVTSSIADDNLGMGRWIIYPAATSQIDGNANCGWQYNSMMGPVLRVNAAGDDILSEHTTIASARNAGTSNTQQIFVIAKSTYESVNFGYDGAVSVESAYPVVFSNSATQPSTIRGINRPRILSNGSGSIEVTNAYATGFTVKDYIEHVGTTATYTALTFNNPGNILAENNFITSTLAAPTTFTGISISNAAGSALIHTLDSNRIKLASNPRWPGGPAVSGSAPATFTGIEIPSHVSGGTAFITNSDISVASASGTKSVGIYVNATNLVDIDVSSNTIYGMAVPNGVASRTNYWGTGIYVTSPSIYSIDYNNIQGGNAVGGKGHDGITLDRPGTGSTARVNNNAISTIAPLSGINMTTPTGPTGARERGYGIKVFSSTGLDNFGSSQITGNNFGTSSSKAPGVASVYVGGTSGTIGPINIFGNTIKNATESANAAIQIATGQYGQAAAHPAIVNIYNNLIGSTVAGESNAMFLAIGTDGSGSEFFNSAGSYEVNVYGNTIRTSQQSIAGSTIEVADGRSLPKGSNIRNIFGYGNGTTLNGLNAAGKGNSGNNTFTHAAILTGETGLANYSAGMTRTGDAIAYPLVTSPAVISRLIASPLAYATSETTTNTVEIRESAGWEIGSEDLYYKETLQFPDHRVLINGPAAATAASPGSAYAELLPGAGGTGVMVTSTGRENKDIRGSIRFNTVGAGLFGRVSVGAQHKGDVYVQTANVGVDNGLAFRHSSTTLPSLASVTGMSNSLNRALDIKAGMDDADDDNYTANTSTLRRTGVFRAGTNSNQFLKETPNAVAGTELMNVFPNPASGDVTVAFKVPVEGMIRVALYDAMGRKVTDLREEYLNIDTYSTTFNAADLPSGTYHVRLMHDLFTVTTSVSVIK